MVELRVASDSVTVCVVLYVPAPGESVGVATVPPPPAAGALCLRIRTSCPKAKAAMISTSASFMLFYLTSQRGRSGESFAFSAGRDDMLMRHTYCAVPQLVCGAADPAGLGCNGPILRYPVPPVPSTPGKPLTFNAAPPPSVALGAKFKLAPATVGSAVRITSFAPAVAPDNDAAA